jgi:hypothetical protein
MPIPAITMSVYYRNYPADYFSPYANSLAVSSKTSNENGLFAGIQWQTDWKIKILAFADLFSMPWLNYRTDFPSQGKSYFAEAIYGSAYDFQASVRYKFSSRHKNLATELQPTYQLEPYTRQNLKVSCRYNLSDKLRFSSQVELCLTNQDETQTGKGFLISQDCQLKFSKFAVFNIRYSQYSIANYDTRIYLYENEVQYAYSMPSFYGNGSKVLLMLKLKLGEPAYLWLKYGYQSDFETREGVHEMKVQLIIKF